MIALRARYNDYIEETGICGDDLVDLDPCSDAFIDIIPHGEARNDMMDACVLRCYDMGQYPSCAARVECLGEEMGGRFDAETDALCRGLRGGVENPPADQWIWGARMDGNEDWDAHLWMTDGDFLDQGAVNQLFGLFHHTRDPGFFSSEQQSNTCGRTLTDEDVYQCYLPGNDWTPGADEFFEHVMITVPR